MSHPFFSIVIPTFNRSDTVARAIESVTTQSFQSLEVVIIDDGSEDNTEMVVRAFTDGRVSFHRQENKGVSAARNFGVGKTAGEFLIFLDSDDEMAADFLQRAYDLITASPGIDCFCFGAVFKRAGNPYNILKPKPLGALFQHRTGLFLAGTFVIRPGAFLRAGMYDSELAYGENDELGQRICKYSELVCSDQISLISHRSPQEEKNRRYKREVMARTLTRYLKMYREELVQIDKNKLVTLNNRLAVCQFVIGQREQAISLLIDTIRTDLNIKSIRILFRVLFLPRLYKKFLNDRGFE